MSVALQSPFTGTKRLFDDADSEAQHHQQQQEAAKRVRCLGGSSPAGAAGRCRPAAHTSTPPGAHHHGLPASTVAAVKALFPGMDEKVGGGGVVGLEGGHVRRIAACSIVVTCRHIQGVSTLMSC